MKKPKKKWRLFVRLSVVSVLILSVSGFVAYMTWMPGSSYSGALPPPSPEEMACERGVRGHVQHLAEEIGPRNLGAPGSLERGASYIEGIWQGQGYVVSSQYFEAAGKQVRNLEVEVQGRTRPDEIVLVGAHYDTHPGSPGAGDNASGVAALLEMGRLLSASSGGEPPARTIRLVAFVNEEMPFARTDFMGSVVYARRSRDRGDDIVAMLSLESIGNYSDAPGSQRFQPPFGWFYPHQGNFLVFAGDLPSRPDIVASLESFRRHAEFPSEGLAAPGWLADTYRSDHWAFWLVGYPGVMVTDTAPFRYSEYHSATDTADTLECDRLARVVAGLHGVVMDLATN